MEYLCMNDENSIRLDAQGMLSNSSALYHHQSVIETMGAHPGEDGGMYSPQYVVLWGGGEKSSPTYSQT